MTRRMGDAIHANVPALAAGGPWDLVAGYVTGSPDVAWTTADMALFAGIPVVTIDQGYTGSPVASADVRDVEQGAWTPAAAVSDTPWTASRPTIYCSLSTLPQVEQAGWQGAVWVADWTGTPPATPPAVPAGMTCVAVQYSDQGGGGAYDLSVVFDPTWPYAAPAEGTNVSLSIVSPAAAEVPAGEVWPGEFFTDGNTLMHIPATTPSMLNWFVALGTPRFEITWAQYQALGGV